MPDREITSHKVNGCNEAIRLFAKGEPGSGGANHIYEATHLVAKGPCAGTLNHYYFQFQDGPIKEVGTNGLTHEVFLAIVIDRLKAFQAGSFACRENAIALTKLEEAVHWLHHRTMARIARGVEGTHEK